MQLREYQQKCVDDCINWIKKSVEPGVVDATVSFGKTKTIAAVAVKIRDMSKKMVLVLAPNGSLCEQNSDEMREQGIPHSLFSASLKQRSMRHPIVIGTPLTIKNCLSRFGSQFAAILIDEGDGLTESVIAIINQIKEQNPNCRVLGFTGTPFRTKTGYIYRLDLEGNPVPKHQTKDPFYAKLIHQTSTEYLMDQGYLTPMIMGDVDTEKYETSHLVAGKAWNKKAIDQAYLGHGRKTASIVADIIEKSVFAEAVMIFGATRQHCEEIMASLPPELSRMVADGMENNKQDLKDFKLKRYRYLVNVNMATVGSNFPHVGVIAVLRKTESPRLLAQILGRGIRLHEDNWPRGQEPSTPELRKEAIRLGPKPFCLYLDYTEDNITTHFPDGNLWNPDIKVSLPGGALGELKCKCPDCNTENTYSARKNPDQCEHDAEGYFVDLAGARIETDHGPIPAHYGRRCYGFSLNRDGTMSQCEYRYTSKDCTSCGASNDIAAKYCCECKAEIVDPNKVLVADFKALKRDPMQRQCDVVEDWNVAKSTTRNGKETWKITWQTFYRSFQTWTACNPMSSGQQYALDMLMDGTKGLTVMPRTVSYRKEPSGFFLLMGFGEKEDEINN